MRSQSKHSTFKQYEKGTPRDLISEQQDEESSNAKVLNIYNQIDEEFQEKKVVILSNQYQNDQIIPLVNDEQSEIESSQNRDLLGDDYEQMTEKDKIYYNYRIINQMINKVQKDQQSLEKKLKSITYNQYDSVINWNIDEKLHKEANLLVIENQRDLIILKTKKLNRVRKEILNIKDLSDEEDPEMFLAIKQIDFSHEEYAIIKDLFATLDLIINKNSLIGFNWEKFTERVFRNKDSVDSFIYKLRYFSFNEMTDYYYRLCKEYSENKKILELFAQKGNQKVPFEIFIIKLFIEWMKIMIVGYDLNLQLIDIIKTINTEKQEIEKLQQNCDILKMRQQCLSEQQTNLGDQIKKISQLLNQLQEIKTQYKNKYNLQEI
ncbi:exonuclease SBCC protein, putative (macronuclear) [Tetrahymena thermophila SB210]|uniref:Exonuclease SBCC protein, putative n=1 Tax=Tetrahymena thermophila (strain SB210) TaxID=312017 RepID=I7M2S2_TETTS|nr:exonuclease SBCC protein, putative [Tetrahymena thermophila SB210]EAS01193.2 exonuclease SBCC protein, putative [Tetrahymena thermophila SB210]|eukprot:XP_001021438.2 exonuclease SBCC protein, putative [Tetrahymena thermophila SB210]